MIPLFVRTIAPPLVIPDAEAARCLDCGVIFSLRGQRDCPTCARPSWAPLGGSWWLRWRAGRAGR